MQLREDIRQLLDLGSIALLVPALAALLVIYCCITTYISYRRLAHIPGPRLAAISELWLFNATSKGDLYLEGERVLRHYGLHTRHLTASRGYAELWQDHPLALGLT